MRHLIQWTAFTVIMVYGFGVFNAALAQDDNSANRLAEIVVSSSPLSGVEAAGTVRRVTADEIKRQGADTLDEALRLIPGVTIREGADGTPRIDIRGFRTRHVQLFLNGIPIRETYDDQFDPTTIPVEYIAEIKVTSGGGSVLYGQGGNGGAIDIITKKGRKGFHGSLSAEAGEGQRYIGRATMGGASERINAFAAVSHFDRDHFVTATQFETPEGITDERLNSDRERTSFFGNMGCRLGESTQLGLTAIHNQGENGKPPVVNYDNTDPFSKRPRYERTDDLQNSQFQAVVNADPQGPSRFRAWGYYNYRQQETNRYDTPTASNNPGEWTQVRRNAFQEDAETRIIGISTQIKYQVSRTGGLTLGLNGELNRYVAKGFRVTNNSGATADIDEDREMRFYSAALEYEHDFNDRVGGVIGYGHQFANKDEGDDDDQFTYLVGLFFNLTDHTLVRVNHARKVRFPSIKQLYSGRPNSPDLVAEITRHYEAGIEQTLPAETTLHLTGFYIEAEDFIERDASDIYRNYQELLFKGFEFSLVNQAIPNATLRLTYAYLDTEDKSDDATRDELQYRPTHTVVIEGQYAFGFGLAFHAALQHVADQYFYDSNVVQKKELEDYTVVNVKVSQTFGGGLELYLGAENLLDEDYEESYGLPQPGRTLYAGVEYRF